MMASRLVKSCLFMLVALAPVAAKASFIIDSFNGGALPNLPGGITVARAFTTPGGATFGLNGTNATVSMDEGSIGRIVYNFSGALSGTGDALGGTPGLKLDFISSTGSVAVSYAINGGTSVAVGVFNASASPFSLEFAVPTLLSATNLTLRFQNLTEGSASFIIDRVTATPEPTTLLLFGAVAGAGFVARRRFGKKAVVA